MVAAGAHMVLVVGTDILVVAVVDTAGIVVAPASVAVDIVDTVDIAYIVLVVALVAEADLMGTVT